VVDDPATAWAQAGPFVHAQGRGVIDQNRVVGLGDVLLGRHAGRTSEDQVVLYNSVGLGVQDAAVAWMLIERARSAGIGSPVVV
jgi:ornithine cyclodeaminase/alanine dehydrogenase-like protein (mu-crystallin family)